MPLFLRVVARVATGLTIFASTGCATITGSSTQTIDIVTLDTKDRPVRGMTCTLTHGPGNYVVDTPAVDLEIRRSASDLEIECRRGSQIAKGTVVSRGESAMAHSFIPGGSIATLVDYMSGAMYTYPSPVRLKIGQHLRFESGGEAKASVVATVGDPTPAAKSAAPAQTSSRTTTTSRTRADGAGSAATQ
jgi:hypothetical protein